MRLFVAYEEERLTLDTEDDQTVGDIKELVREAFSIGPDEGPGGIDEQDKKTLTLTHNGSNLCDNWRIDGIGLDAACTIKAILKLEEKPLLYIHCGYNDEMVSVFDKMNVAAMEVCDLRALATRKTGLPVGVFRMLNKQGVELFDGHVLYDYGIEVGDTIEVQTWDGWNDFLTLATIGFTSYVIQQLSNDDVIARYQMKVAIHIAAHYGHTDLAVTLMKQGIRADEPVGYHPLRQWCTNSIQHIDSFKPPIHEAAEMGQIGVLRSFVHHNVCNVLAKDGNDLTPLNISLRKRQKACASFLLTKQWSKMNYTKRASIPLSIFVKMKRWSDRAKDKVLLFRGPWKSSIKNPRRHMATGALVSNGVQLDGFTHSKMTSKPAAQVRVEEEQHEKKMKRLYSIKDQLNAQSGGMDPEFYFKSLGTIQTLKLPRLSKWSKMLSKAVDSEKKRMEAESKQAASDEAKNDDKHHTAKENPDRGSETSMRPRSNTTSMVKLPPIVEKGLKISKMSSSEQNLTSSSQRFSRAVNKTGFVIQTGQKLKDHSSNGSNIRERRSVSETLPAKRTKASSLEISVNHAKAQKERSVRSALLLAKARTEELPNKSVEFNPRPYAGGKSEKICKDTMSLYESYRGLTPREYAIKCLSVANTFKEKPWLAQVKQAMTIASKGVRKTFNMQGHMFQTRADASLNELQESFVDNATATAVQ